MRKLIRDKMSRWGRINGKHVRLCKDVDEYDRLILEKVKEEFAELLEAIDRNKDVGEVVGEACDLIEVVAVLVNRYAGCSLDLVLSELKHKRDVRGGFDAGVVLEDDE